MNPRLMKFRALLRKNWWNGFHHALWLTRGFGQEGDSASANDRTYSESYYRSWTDCDFLGFARVLLAELQPQSVLDVGCGNGELLWALKSLQPELRLVGLENSRQGVEVARQRGIDVKPFNIIATRGHHFYEWKKSVGNFDLTVCFEVGEHLPFWHAGTLVSVVTSTSNQLIFSAAKPGQGGIMHLNEQPAIYWIRKIEHHGFSLNSHITERFAAQLGNLNIPEWYKTNSRVFFRD